MLVVLIIISVLSLLASTTAGVIISKKSDKERQYSSEMTKQEFAYGAGYWLATVTTISLALLFGYLDSRCTPKAIDVYRNNTHMSITYTIENGDTIKSDTTVVFNKNVKP
jgi:type II secretory pathway pseudopilin PulG